MAIVCKTCGEPYRKHKKGVMDRSSLCSSSFHCCKDCKWECETIGGFCGMKLIKRCPECEEIDKHNKEEWKKRK